MLGILITVVFGLLGVFLGIKIYQRGYLTTEQQKHMKKYFELPTPQDLPVFGSMLFGLYNRENMPDANYIFTKQHGAYIRWRMPLLPGPYPYGLHTADPRDVQYILSDNFSNFPKGEFQRSMLAPVFGQGIFAVDDELWKSQRKMARPLFTNTSRADMAVVFKEKASMVLLNLENASRMGEPIDIQDQFMRYTLDSFGKIGFGVDIHSLKAPVAFSAAFDTVQYEADQIGFNPLRVYVPWIQMRFNKQMKVVEDFVYGIIREKREERAKEMRETGQISPKKDLLSRYLDMEGTMDEYGHPVQLSDKYLRDILLNFFIAGRDTTSLLLSWTIYELTRHPEVEQKLVEEIRSVLGHKLKRQQLHEAQEGYTYEDNVEIKTEEDYHKGDESSSSSSDNSSGTSEHIITLKDLHNLKYMHAVLQESLRLHPPVPANIKVVKKDDVLPSGIPVLAGMVVGYNPYTIHRLQEYWGSDAEEFNPNRWLTSPIIDNKKGEGSGSGGILKHKYQFIPFQKGPRICMGMDMAYEEAKMMLIQLLPRFTLCRVSNDPVTYKKALTLPIKGGLKVIVSKREIMGVV